MTIHARYAAAAPASAPDSQHTHRASLAALTLGALGVVYGDIGTSPLYAMQVIFDPTHSHAVPVAPAEVLGVLSLVFWSLMWLVSIKYVWFLLRNDNEGEGGIMALMALASLAVSRRGAGVQRFVLIIGLFGTALFYGDGALTPAISVLSAVEGISIVTPAFEKFVSPIALVILIGLFMIQSKGTGSVGKLFGPIMVVWFLVLAALGLSQIATYPAVLSALNPLYAAQFFLMHPLISFLSLGSVFLVVTGGEALYADMGHFGRQPIRLAWFGLALPALVLNYFGQGALLLTRPEVVDNPFYKMAPSWALIPLVVLATMATVIASQAVISGTFSLTRQAIQLGYLPRMEVRHTSAQQQGQIYVPSINWLLLIVIIGLVLSFGSSARMATAYGVSIILVMGVTTSLTFFVTHDLRRWPLSLALLGSAPFLLTDFTFLAANVPKIPDGGWFTLLFGAVVFILLTTWKQGRLLVASRIAEEGMEVGTFMRSVTDGHIPRSSGTAIYLTTNLLNVPHALLHSIKHYKVIHERIVFATVVMEKTPRVAPSQRVQLEALGSNFWRLTIRYGFMEAPQLPSALKLCDEKGLALDPMDVSYFLGRETLIPKPKFGMPYWREVIFIAMFRNASNAADFLGLPANRVVELGSQVEI